MLTACVGYGVFGDALEGPILSNLPTTGIMGDTVCLVKLVVVLSIYCTYPILLNVLVLELEELLGLVDPALSPARTNASWSLRRPLF